MSKARTIAAYRRQLYLLLKHDTRSSTRTRALRDINTGIGASTSSAVDHNQSLRRSMGYLVSLAIRQ
jgi:hypothetical protein